MQNESQHGDVLLRGVGAIGAELGMKLGTAYHHIRQRRIKCVKRIGARYVASRSQLRREFGLEG